MSAEKLRLTPEQRDEVNELLERLNDDPEQVLFELVYARDRNTRAAVTEKELRAAVLDYLQHPSSDGSPFRQQKRERLQTLAKIEKEEK